VRKLSDLLECFRSFQTPWIPEKYEELFFIGLRIEESYTVAAGKRKTGKKYPVLLLRQRAAIERSWLRFSATTTWRACD
jgi:hypothetical protein